MTAVGVYLYELRQAQELTQKAVADYVDVSDRAVASWETGKHAPKIDVMPKLLKFLRGTWDDIIELMADNASEEMARARAKRRRSGGGLTDDQRAFLEGLDDEQRAALLTFAEQVLRRP